MNRYSIRYAIAGDLLQAGTSLAIGGKLSDTLEKDA
jgi:hypothetical protein